MAKNIDIRVGKGRKHCGKRRKCWFPAFSPFPTMFSKASSTMSLKVGIVWSRANIGPADRVLALSKLKAFADDKIKCYQKHYLVFHRVETLWGKGGNGDYQHFFSILKMFLRYLTNNGNHLFPP